MAREQAQTGRMCYMEDEQQEIVYHDFTLANAQSDARFGVVSDLLMPGSDPAANKENTSAMLGK